MTGVAEAYVAVDGGGRRVGCVSLSRDGAAVDAVKRQFLPAFRENWPDSETLKVWRFFQARGFRIIPHSESVALDQLCAEVALSG